MDQKIQYLSIDTVITNFKQFYKLIVFILLIFSVKDWVHLIAFSAAAGGAGYLAVKPYYDCYYGKGKDVVVNLEISKEKEKVVDFVDVEDLGEKACFCRCWRSKKVSFCVLPTSLDTIFEIANCFFMITVLACLISTLKTISSENRVFVTFVPI